MHQVQDGLHVQWKSIHCGYVPGEEPAPPPNTKLVIEPQIDPLQAEKMFIDYVAQLTERCADSICYNSYHDFACCELHV